MNRRTLLGRALAAGAGAALARGGVAAEISPLDGSALYDDVVAYDALGPHRTATASDLATTDWLERGFRSAGFAVDRQAFSVTLHEPTLHRLDVADRRLTGFPLWPPVQTPASGVRARLAEASGAGPAPDLHGRIAVLTLPYVRRGVTLGRPDYRNPIVAALKAGAVGLVLITEGPAGDLIGLNALPPGMLAEQAPLAPMLLVAGRHGDWLRSVAREGREGVLELRGASRDGATAYNLVARLERGPRWIVLSTPQSGWFHCAGERGPGVAIQRGLARWAARRSSDVSLCAVVTSGHELAGIGARRIYQSPSLPAPDETRLWVFLGSSIATRRWRTTTSADAATPRVLPLEGPDPRRTLYGSPSVMAELKRAFAGVAGLEAPRTATAEGGPGSPTPLELREALAHGYGPGVGVKGNHLFQHAMGDRAHTTSPEILAPAANAFAALLAQHGV